MGWPKAKIDETQFNFNPLLMAQGIKIISHGKQGTFSSLQFSLHSSWILNWIRRWITNIECSPLRLPIRDLHHLFRIMYSLIIIGNWLIILAFSTLSHFHFNSRDYNLFSSSNQIWGFFVFDRIKHRLTFNCRETSTNGSS